jgi:integrase
MRVNDRGAAKCSLNRPGPQLGPGRFSRKHRQQGKVGKNASSFRPSLRHSSIRARMIKARQVRPLRRRGYRPYRLATFRHSYSALLRSLAVDVKVQQELLRHADIRTTMNIYTQAVPEALREANSKVVRMVLPTTKTAEGTHGVPQLFPRILPSSCQRKRFW